MTERSKEELIEILDNIIYWDSCPELYKEKIPDLITEIKALNIPVVSERKIVRCEDPMVCLRGCSVHEQTCKHPIYER